MSTATLRKALAVVIGVIVLAALFEVLRINGRDTTTRVVLPAAAHPALGPATTADSAAAVAAAASATATAGRAATAGRTGHGAGGSPLPAAGAPPVDPGPVMAPAPGSYSFRYTIDQRQTTGALQVAKIASGADVVSESETSAQPGLSDAQTLAWTPSAAVLTASAIAGAAPCQWAPPITMVKSPLAPGATWQSDSSCTFEASAGKAARLQVIEQDKVDALARVTIDGQPVQVFVIERHRLFTESGIGASITIERQATDLFSPALGLAVYEVAKTVTPNPNGSVATTTTVSELLHTKPS